LLLVVGVVAAIMALAVVVVGYSKATQVLRWVPHTL
jgi:hypothetical protein